MDRAVEFNASRRRLFGIAYRMLGSRAEAEDVVQDAYIRWHTMDDSIELRSAQAWLVTVVTRLAIDRLRTLKIERESYPGPWLPEPLEDASAASPESAAELADDVSIALLTVLERLAPEERAAFLLHEAFDVDYPDIARTLNKSEAACRQLVHRSRQRVRADRPRFQVSDDVHRALLQRFSAAARSARETELLALFANDATLTVDGGGKVPSTRRTLHGAERIARFHAVIAKRLAGHPEFVAANINGEPGLLRYVGGELDCALSFVTDGERIHHVFMIRNPDKLKGLSRLAGGRLS